MAHRISPINASVLLGLPLVAAFAGCSSDSDSDSSFTVRSTDQAVAASTVIAISGSNLAFLASEGTTGAGGTDFNNDGDKTDSIAVAVPGGGDDTVLNVAADDLAWIGNELYLVVDEADDDNDWNTDLDTTDIVLLHWSRTANALTFVADLPATGTRLLAIGTNLFYAGATTTVGANQSNLRRIASSAPLTVVEVETTDATAELTVEILGEDEGLVFLGLDEVGNARDLNGDADQTDGAVLALLNGTVTTGEIRNVELALADPAGPFRARSSGSSDWQVGFLVSETDQGAVNLNDPGDFDSTWQPPQCAGEEDADTTDAVLHFLEFAAWNADPVATPPVNSGLVGSKRIVIANNFIGTISTEADEGTCDLNDDGDTADDVVRWTEIVASPSPVLPLTSEANIRALFDVPGGTHGLAELGTRFVIVVSESDDNVDINGGGMTMNLVGWLSPSNTSTAWDFTHTSPTQVAVGASWMGDQPDRARLDVALEERVLGNNINSHTPPVPGEDTDTNDSVPTFAQFSGNTLTFPGVAIAVEGDNGGIIVARGFGFYRVSEAEDSRDWNADGDETDFVLFRTSLTQGTSQQMGALNNATQLAVRFNTRENPSIGAFLASEALQGAGGTDFNNDGDTLDLVVRYFNF